MRRVGALIPLILLLILGCAPVAPQRTGPPVEPLPFADLLRSPELHAGKRVRVGGVIVKTEIRQDVTVIEIYQTRMDQQGRPVDIDRSEGRFLGYYAGLLESEIYRQGRRITVVGVVRGGEIRRLGDRDYDYPVLDLREIDLWDERPAVRYVSDPWYPWGPYYGWFPWYYPYRNHRYHGRRHPGRPHYGHHNPGRPHHGNHHPGRRGTDRFGDRP